MARDAARTRRFARMASGEVRMRDLGEAGIGEALPANREFAGGLRKEIGGGMSGYVGADSGTKRRKA